MQLVVESLLDPEVRIRADAPPVEQILFNLVDNACKYGGSSTDRRIHLRAEAGDKTVCLEVRDHGHGVAPEMIRNLFVPFSKSAAQAAGTAPGVGLGLALCRRLAQSRGGDLRYQGSADGAVFILTLPRA
jgi:signal transduction histidine kinase